jgi:hypothetical protein
LIDVELGELILRFQDEHVIFNVYLKSCIIRTKTLNVIRLR